MNSISMDELRATLSKYPVRTRLSLTGTIVVARDIAHAKMLQKIESGEGLPQYAKDYIIYYAGPAKTPDGYASGSFGPTTAGRMDSYVDKFMQNGGSFVTLAKGNRHRGHHRLRHYLAIELIGGLAKEFRAHRIARLVARRRMGVSSHSPGNHPSRKRSCS